jgi:hypothetical protein
MTRNGRTASAGNGSASPEEASSQDALNIQGFDAARGLMSSSLESLTGMVSWLDQLQALNNSMLAGWSQALALSARDLDQAKDPEQVMALPAQMVNHHLEQTSRQLAQAMQDLFEAQVKWADRWRTQIADQMQRAMASGRQPGGASGGAQPAAAAALGQFQDQWLAMTRKWIDAVGAAVPAQPGFPGR